MAIAATIPSARGDLRALIAQLLADYRHNRLEVTYGRKKCSVMAIDEMTADRVLLLIDEEHEAMLVEYERAGLLWRNPAPNAAAAVSPGRSVVINRNGVRP